MKVQPLHWTHDQLANEWRAQRGDKKFYAYRKPLGGYRWGVLTHQEAFDATDLNDVKKAANKWLSNYIQSLTTTGA